MRALLAALVLLGLFAATPASAQTFQVCQWVLGPSASFVDRSFFAGPTNGMTLTSAGCHCKGTCSTAARFTWEDQSGNAIDLTGGGSLPCQTGTTAITFVTFDGADGDRVLTTGEVVRYDVANTPTSTDEVLLCLRFTSP